MMCSVRHRVEVYLERTFYNLTTVSLHNWRTYGEMRKVQYSTVRVASDTSFKEEYFFGAFSILPDTSFLLWS